jgi:hypothetical protein
MLFEMSVETPGLELNGVQVITEKTKYVFLLHHQIAGQNHKDHA